MSSLDTRKLRPASPLRAIGAPFGFKGKALDMDTLSCDCAVGAAPLAWRTLSIHCRYLVDFQSRFCLKAIFNFPWPIPIWMRPCCYLSELSSHKSKILRIAISHTNNREIYRVQFINIGFSSYWKKKERKKKDRSTNAILIRYLTFFYAWQRRYEGLLKSYLPDPLSKICQN